MKKTIPMLIATFAIALVSAQDGRALARAFISINGNDANACSPTAPCRTLSGAMIKVFEGGEIVVMDSGLFGNVQIDKSVTIMGAPGVHAGVGADTKAGTAVSINAPLNSTVVLRNLYITTRDLNQLFYGIDFVAGGTLHIENCVVAGFKHYGLRVNESAICDAGCPRVSVEDSFVRGNGIGIALRSAVTVIEHSRIEENTLGIQLGGRTQTTVRDSIVTRNSDTGITLAFLSTGRLESSSITDNGTGLMVFSDSNSPGTFYVADTLVSGNNVGLKYQSGESTGKIYSFGNNRLFGNSTNGNFTDTLQLQ